MFDERVHQEEKPELKGTFMEKVKSVDEFSSLYDRLTADRNSSLPTLVIPAGTCGQASGANDLIRITKRELLNKKLTEKIRLRITGCHGFCEMEPSILIEPWEFTTQK